MKAQKKEHTLARALLLFFSALLIAGTSEAQVAAGNDAHVLGGTPGTSEPAAAPSTYRLIGTVEGGAFAGAVLDDAAAGAQTFYRLRDALPDGSQIVKVQSDSISVKRSDGMVYELYIIHDMKTAAPSARPPAGASPAVPRFTDNQRMADMLPGQAPGAASDDVRGGGKDRRKKLRNPKADAQGMGANQGTYGPGSNTSAPGDGRARRVPRQQGRAPQSPD